MADTYTEIVEKASEQTTAAIKQAQELTVAAVSSVAEFVAGIIPDLPALPFADQLPSPVEVVESNFKFVNAVLGAQKDFALSLAQAAAPKSV
jgi:hypothetical protein